MPTIQLVRDGDRQLAVIPPEHHFAGSEANVIRVGSLLILSPLEVDAAEELDDGISTSSSGSSPSKLLSLKPKGADEWAKFAIGVGSASDDFMVERQQPNSQVRDLDFE